MASKPDTVAVPRKWIDAAISGFIGLIYWLLLQGYQWGMAIDKHLQSTDRSVWELQQKPAQCK